jgi:hypothetical protein
MRKFSLVVLYSVDRKRQLENCLACWADMLGYVDCEKILVVDGKTNIRPPGWHVLEVEREGEYYCWANTLNAGVDHATTECVFYFDSDRILPVDYFEKALPLARDGFVFPQKLFWVQDFKANATALRSLCEHPDQSKLIPDHRVMDPLMIGQKNPFSGCVGFSKKVFLETGGFDPRFKGWGYPDYDFFMNVTRRGLKLVPLNVVELHQRHEYSINRQLVFKHNFWNLNQYVQKWNLPIRLLDKMKQKKIAVIPPFSLEKATCLREFLDICDFEARLL